jgi:hypothetical protein
LWCLFAVGHDLKPGSLDLRGCNQITTAIRG